MAELLPWPVPQFFDDNGHPLAGGKLYSYRAGSSIPLATYADKAATTPNPNPVILNSRGEATVYLSPQAYKLVLTDANDVVIWTRDNFVLPNLDTETLAEAIELAQDAQQAAEDAQQAAEDAKQAAENARDAADAAKIDAEAAKNEAIDAKLAAELAQAAAEEAQSRAEDAQSAAEQAQAAAESARDEAVAASLAIGSEISFNIENNQTTPADITGMVFDKDKFKSAIVHYFIQRITDEVELVESGQFIASYLADSDSWRMTTLASDEDSGVTISIDSGQGKYVSTNIAGSPIVSKISFRITTLVG